MNSNNRITHMKWGKINRKTEYEVKKKAKWQIQQSVIEK